MKIITEEELMKLTNAEKCRVIICILRKELVYKRSVVYEESNCE